MFLTPKQHQFFFAYFFPCIFIYVYFYLDNNLTHVDKSGKNEPLTEKYLVINTETISSSPCGRM